MKVINIQDVCKRTNLSRSTVLRLEETSQFPPKVALSKRRVGWIEEEVILWIQKNKGVKSEERERISTRS